MSSQSQPGGDTEGLRDVERWARREIVTIAALCDDDAKTFRKIAAQVREQAEDFMGELRVAQWCGEFFARGEQYGREEGYQAGRREAQPDARVDEAEAKLAEISRAYNALYMETKWRGGSVVDWASKVVAERYRAR
jgi:flagellar biosynthesis/type III secretory pathway protein FliH